MVSEVISVDLDELERDLLVSGLQDWDGPAASSERIAQFFGYANEEERRSDFDLILERLIVKAPLSKLQWTRALLGAELIFGSDIVGTGREWGSIHARTNEEWLSALRRLQAKLPHDRSLLDL